MLVRVATNLGSFAFDPFAPSPKDTGGPSSLSLLAPEVTIDLGAAGPQTFAPWGHPRRALSELPPWVLPLVLVLAVLLLGFAIGCAL